MTCFYLIFSSPICLINILLLCFPPTEICHICSFLLVHKEITLRSRNNPFRSGLSAFQPKHTTVSQRLFPLRTPISSSTAGSLCSEKALPVVSLQVSKPLWTLDAKGAKATQSLLRAKNAPTWISFQISS